VTFVPRREPVTVLGLRRKLLGLGALDVGYFDDEVVVRAGASGQLLLHSEKEGLKATGIRSSVLDRVEAVGEGLYQTGPVEGGSIVVVRWG
jgi:hypothetical protein